MKEHRLPAIVRLDQKPAVMAKFATRPLEGYRAGILIELNLQN